MKTNIFLLTLALTMSLHTLQAHDLDRDLHISPRVFDSTGMFKATKKGEALSGAICKLDPQLVMTSCFLKIGTIQSLTIQHDLSMYSNKTALQKAVASCINAKAACGYTNQNPALAEWEAMSLHCNPPTFDGVESMAEFRELIAERKRQFSAWLKTISPANQEIVHKLEAFMQKILIADFAAGTYYFGLHTKTRAHSHSRRPATA